MGVTGEAGTGMGKVGVELRNISGASEVVNLVFFLFSFVVSVTLSFRICLVCIRLFLCFFFSETALVLLRGKWL